MLSFSTIILLQLYISNTEIFVMLVQQTVIHDILLNPV